MVSLPSPLEQQQRHPSILPTVPAPLFAGRVNDRKKKRDRAKVDELVAKYSAGRPVGARYTYNWGMWRFFGIATCIRCTGGWFLLFFAICCILVVLWIFGVLWICVFSSGFCEIRS